MPALVTPAVVLLLALAYVELIQPAAGQGPLTPDECPDSNPAGVSWAVIHDYDNGNASRYGDLTTTLCECVQACLSLPGCSGFDWYLKGTHTLCWLGTNCPVTLPTLEYDVTNLHYFPTYMSSCYPYPGSFASAGTLLQTGCGALFTVLLIALQLALKN